MNFLSAIEPNIGTEFLTYQLKVALILVGFFLSYHLLMSRETFHKLNRFLLTSMLVASFVLPFCVFKIHRYVPEEVLAEMTARDKVAAPVVMPAIPILPPQLNNAVQSEIKATPSVSKPAPVAEKPVRRFNWGLLGLAIWFAGFVFHLSRFILSVVHVRRLIRLAREVSSDDNIRIHVVDRNVSPFSWMNNIVISREDYESVNRNVIIDHEKSHVRLGHSYDIVLVDLLSSLQWFNPVTSMLRKDLQDVHEYQVDGCVLRDGFDAKAYQYMLLGKIASLSGFSVTNHFKKQNLSERIRMMNRKDSKFSRAFKALYAPLLTGLVVMSFAVTVYDCKAGSIFTRRADGRTMDALRDSMVILDDLYGQGKFNRTAWENGGIWLTEGDSVIVRTGDSFETVMKADEVADYLLDYKGFRSHRMTIVLSNLQGNQTETGLKRARPLIDMLNEVGIYSLVVKSDQDYRDAHYSTYRYGRIYTWEPGIYELDHNGLIIHGTPAELADWIKAVDIEFLAFYPDNIMPWSDASVMMDAAYERGSRTFSVCVFEPTPATAVYASASDASKDNGQLSRRYKKHGNYRMTVLPTRRDLDYEFKGKTVMDVERRLREEYTDDYIARASKVVDNPPVFDGSAIDKAVFCDDALVLVNKYTGLQRNNWSRPPLEEGRIVLVADGKEYRMLRQEGFQNFADYQYRSEYNYANGCYFWVPESGYMNWSMVFEPVPDDVKSFDVVQIDPKTDSRNYVMRGVNISRDRHRFDGIKVIQTACQTELDLKGTQGGDLALVQRIESTSDALQVMMHLYVRASNTYPAYFGSDITLTLNDGTDVKVKSASVPLDKDFARAGDYVMTNATLEFPAVDIDRLVPDVENGRCSKLSGTLCHEPFELVLNRMAVPF